LPYLKGSYGSCFWKISVHFNSNPLRLDSAPRVHPSEPKRCAIAISSQTGAGALPIGQKLADHLQADSPSASPPWTVFDKSLMAKVLEDHHLPTRMAKFLPEDANGVVDDVLDELFGLHPSSWVIVQKSIQTILNLMRAGNVILVGWGSNVITSELPNVFHVRLVGSLEMRMKRIQQRDHLGPKEALVFINRQDRGRARYVKRYFGQELQRAPLPFNHRHGPLLGR